MANIKDEMRDRLREAVAVRDEILAKVAPLREQEEKLLPAYWKARDELQAVRDEIVMIEGPERLAEASRVIAMCARAGVKLEG